MFKITQNEWNTRHKDYKSIIDGQKYILKDCRLIPVEIDNINGKELKMYTFYDGILTYQCLAWDIEDVKSIAKSNHHYKCENIRLKQ